MPLMSCTTEDGKPGHKYGKDGKCYADRNKAVRQAAAIKASQKRRGKETH